MDIQRFFQTLRVVHKKYQAKQLHQYQVDQSTGALTERGALSTIWWKFLHSIQQASEEKELVNMVYQLANLYFGTSLSKKDIENKFHTLRKNKKLQGFSFKSLSICEQIRNALISDLAKNVEPDIIKAAGENAEKITKIYQVLMQALVPSFHSIDEDLIDEYEQVVSFFLSAKSAWLEIPANDIILFANRLQKEKLTLKLCEQLKKIEKKWVVQCKSIVEMVDKLLQLSRKLAEFQVHDYRFDLKELEAIQFIAERFTYQPKSNQSAYTQLFNALSITELHPQYKKKVGETKRSPSFVQLQEAIKLSKKHLQIVDELAVLSTEIAERQYLIKLIMFGEAAKKMEIPEKEYPFVCKEWEGFAKSSAPISNFQKIHLEKIMSPKLSIEDISDEKIHDIYRDYRSELIDDDIDRMKKIFDKKDVKERNVLKQEWLDQLSEGIRNKIHISLSQSKCADLLDAHFHKSKIRLGEGKKHVLFDLSAEEQKLYDYSGKELKQHIEKRYGKFSLFEWTHKYPELFTKKENTPVDSMIIQDLRQKEIELFWREINKRYRRILQKENPKDTPQQWKELLHQRRTLIRTYLNETILVHNRKTFFGKKEEEKKVAAQVDQKFSIGMFPPQEVVYYIDDELKMMGYEKQFILYEKKEVGSDLAKLDSLQRPVTIGEFTQCLQIDLNKDQASFVVYKNAAINDRSVGCIEQIQPFLDSLE